MTLLRRPVPAAGLPEDNTEKEKAPWWKLRKWTLRISLRLISRYGDPKITRSDNSLPFSKLFLEEFSADFLKVRHARKRTPHACDRLHPQVRRAASAPAPPAPSACTHRPGFTVAIRDRAAPAAYPCCWACPLLSARID